MGRGDQDFRNDNEDPLITDDDNNVDSDVRAITYCLFCRQLIPPQKGPLYCCLDKYCSFSPHSIPGRILKSCFELPRQISHPLHPQHTLSLLARPPYASGSFLCNACGKRGSGFTFHCAVCKFDLDVCCASLIPIEGGKHETMIASHFGLDGTSHSWIIYDRHGKFKVLCSACRLPIESQICVCLECKIFLHESCTQLPKKIEHPLHRGHPLVLFRWKTSYPSDDGSREQPCKECWGGRGHCNACRDGFEGSFAYQCFECKFKLDIKCAFLTPRTYDFHEHPLVLVCTSFFACDRCQCRDCAPMLRCISDCDFNLHLHCVPSLPRTVKYERHVHPLMLTDSPIKNYLDEDDDGEFYCDACEELRSLPDPTYFCKECHYVGHVRCVISDEELFSLGKELSTVGQQEDNNVSNSPGIMEDSASNETVEVIKVEQESKNDGSNFTITELDHEIESVASELEALMAKLKALEQERSSLSQAPIHYDT